jgi:hypothetical protein
MPNPLMGFSLQGFAPHVQPYAVSGAATLMTLVRQGKLHDVTG